ncbi:Serine incorporator/TMS membrane protein [Dioscorea alata]|uniref:Serine incorporator/TMS membrane protein n=1 Tax=Dioscorea alata TaxID=55571 RepID=A0ACB7UAT0_DIOAL|nr:Serine incorporator/TMS membrane protein [Dioscorea alata]
MTHNEMDIEGASTRERYNNFMEESCCTQFCTGPNPSMARYVYGLMFLVTSLLAWTVRDYGHTALAELQRLKVCEGTRYCLGAEGVLRISFGCFIFFFIMFLSTAGTKKLEDPRNSWHSEWWAAKIVLWIVLLVVPFFVPSAFIQLYGKVAHFGAGVFLLIQLMSVISFITWLNDCCRSEKYADRCRINSLILSVSAYLGSLLGIVMMYIWYAPKPTCRLNIFFITLTLLLLHIMTLVSVHSKVKGGLLATGLMGMYIVFLCWSALRSEPVTEICNKKAQAATNADWLTILSFVIAVLVIVMATFATGVDSNCLQQLKKTEPESEDSVPYGYGFFHFVFSVGSMYFAMLFIGWNSHKTMKKWTIDVGWASAWVRIVNEWLATLVYIWMLVVPLIWKSRRRAEST